MFCSKCGSYINAGDVSCPNCGEELKAADIQIVAKKQPQNKKKINLWALLGCIIGILAIVVGITILCSETEISRDKGSVSFGADFYTEMHKVTRNTFISTLRMNETLNMGCGWLIIIIGFFGLCHFAPKVSNKNIKMEDY